MLTIMTLNLANYDDHDHWTDRLSIIVKHDHQQPGGCDRGPGSPVRSQPTDIKTLSATTTLVASSNVKLGQLGSDRHQQGWLLDLRPPDESLASVPQIGVADLARSLKWSPPSATSQRSRGGAACRAVRLPEI